MGEREAERLGHYEDAELEARGSEKQPDGKGLYYHLRPWQAMSGPLLPQRAMFEFVALLLLESADVDITRLVLPPKAIWMSVVWAAV